MRFLHDNEIAEWCRNHGGTMSNEWDLNADPSLVASSQLLFAPDGPIGREAEVADLCIAALGDFAEALLWLEEWGIWPGSEDWPTYYAARGVRGERQSVSEKPGHLFSPADRDDLREFLLLLLKQGWGGHLIGVREGRLAPRIWISHDGWAQLYSTVPTAFELSPA